MLIVILLLIVVSEFLYGYRSMLLLYFSQFKLTFSFMLSFLMPVVLLKFDMNSVAFLLHFKCIQLRLRTLNGLLFIVNITMSPYLSYITLVVFYSLSNFCSPLVALSPSLLVILFKLYFGFSI